MKIDPRVIREAAAAASRRHAGIVADLRAAELRGIASAKDQGMPLGDKHWHGRHRAELRLKASDAILAALDEVLA